jgi:predicted nucleic acid-binding protein
VNPIRVYVDTSIFGGLFDDEFSEPSKPFFEQVTAGLIQLVISPIVLQELHAAPDHVRRCFDEISHRIELAPLTTEAEALQRAYLDAHVLGARWESDAMHVAMATLSGCQVIVSWNFKHLVNFRRIPLYNAVNEAQGYAAIAIHTPPEVVQDED